MPQSPRRFAFGFALLLPLAACVPESQWDETMAELQRSRAHGVRADARVAKLTGEIDRLQADVAARDQKLAEAGLQESNLRQSVEQLTALNAELSARLKSAGVNVEQLASERGSLMGALAESRRKLEELARTQAAAEVRAAEFRDLLRSFQGMVDAGKLKVVVRNNRMVLELPNDVLFDSGKTAVKSVGKSSLVEVARILRGMPKRRFEVAGHTDDVNIRSARFPSNWDLSTARAVVVTKLLVQDGMNPHNLSAAGYGEFSPVADNASAAGRAKNRRIEIALLPNVEGRALPAPPKVAAEPAASSGGAVSWNGE
jgi:chemotaxis protein MotB